MQMVRADVRGRVMDGVDLTGLDYLPTGFSIQDGVMRSRQGECRLSLEARALLAFGDSVTVMSTPDASGLEEATTWPVAVAAASGVELCEFAESGFHPSDLAQFAEAIQPRLVPAHAVIVLCANDLVDQTPRFVTRREGDWAVVPIPLEMTVHPPTWWPWLGARSESYRFLSYRLAAAAGQAARVRPDWIERRAPDVALARLRNLDPLIVYVPRLDASWKRLPQVDQLARASGATILTMPRPADPVAIRREPHDDVHMSAAGHKLLADFVLQNLEK